MAEQKRHRDVPKERFLESLPSPAQTPNPAGWEPKQTVNHQSYS